MDKKKGFLDKLGSAISPVPGFFDLLEMSAHANGFKRENAVRRLGMIGDPASIPHLIIRANDWVPQVRAVAREVLIKMLKTENGDAFVASLPAILHLQTCRRDDHTGLVRAVEEFLLREEHRHYLESALQSGDPRVARLAVRLLTNSPKANAVQLVADCLSHKDVIVRSIVVDLLKELGPDDFQSVIARAVHDRYMPVRREAFQQLLARNSEDGLRLARTFLFDASGSIREIAIRRLLEAGERVEEIYAEALSASGGRAAVAVCVLWGWGFMKCHARSDQVRAQLGSPLPRVRRAALQAVFQLQGNAARQCLMATLSDASPAVANEAARLVVRIDDRIGADQLIAIARTSGHRHVAIACCRVSRDLSKWCWLKFVLSVYGAPPFPVDQETLVGEVDAWNRQFNRSSAQPDASSLGDIAAALRVCESRLTGSQVQLLHFTLRTYGVSQ